MQFNLLAAPNEPFFHSSTACEPPTEVPQPMKVVVWLKEDSTIVGSRIFCFTEEFHIEKERDLLITTDAFGPIGVKGVVDALRMAPDEPILGKKSMARQQIWNFNLLPDQILHIVWEPSVPAYFFYQLDVPSGPSGSCNFEPDAPEFPEKPFFILENDGALCHSILLERPVQGGMNSSSAVRVTVPMNCQ